MAIEDAQSAVSESACFNCIPPGMQAPVQTYLLDQIRNSLTTGWDDLVFPPASLNPPGGANGAVLLETSGQGTPGQLALRFTAGAGDTIWITVQMAHTWVPGTRIYPHMHVQPQTTTGFNMTWVTRYSISDIFGTFPDSTQVSEVIAMPDNRQWRHHIFNLPSTGIDMSAYAGPSTIIRLRYELTVAAEAVDLVSFDVHFLKTISPVAFNPAP
jgi:hypothetical protein